MSWNGVPASRRFCAGCGQKVTLAADMPLWFEFVGLDSTPVVWHHQCKLEALGVAA